MKQFKEIVCKCGYKWQPRVPHPKECPECHARLGKQEKKS